ncbi:hypothetical protein DMC30DRAFT_93027 [Rhodotorula diobovata]|uniref:MYND-type domain-containing protein n=1 Tax=Rhodotorula diobovata TaxID=5288 RepID=A0A5C5FNE8_9BASI|nr:hypothetical protein DMC30DRAFT_93027 [Rhodotorula diobovata]
MGNPQASATCAVCQDPATTQCGACRAVSVCSVRCQRLLWLIHKELCGRNVDEFYAPPLTPDELDELEALKGKDLPGGHTAFSPITGCSPQAPIDHFARSTVRSSEDPRRGPRNGDALAADWQQGLVAEEHVLLCPGCRGGPGPHPGRRQPAALPAQRLQPRPPPAPRPSHHLCAGAPARSPALRGRAVPVVRARQEASNPGPRGHPPVGGAGEGVHPGLAHRGRCGRGGGKGSGAGA